MISLKNINKTYISKSKQRVDALKDINLEIVDRGMVFILGKSGSGKSTLLNILGGIDNATSGEVFIDNVSFTDFKQADYDSYRNRYVGFVFQEFNLLHDFNVRDNVSIALQLSKEDNVSEKVAKALEQVKLSSDYLTRRIDELSGGEKQRIAIARAIVKDSHMILADEPTGNLDSGTGASILNILKNLSGSKLVIVVTHDRESAEKYSDRIIEIADGKIIQDNNGDQTPEDINAKNTFEPKKRRLSNKVCFKMGINNLLQRKAKTVSVALLSIFTIFALLLMQMTLSFSAEKSFAKFIIDNEIDYVLLDQGKLKYGNEFNPKYILKPSTLNYISDNCSYIRNGRIEKKQDILDLGLTFINDALELSNDSYYITDQGLEEAYRSRYSYVIVEGEEVKLVKERHPIEFLVGKKVDIGSHWEMNYTLAGVVDTAKCNDLVEGFFPTIFAKENFDELNVVSMTQNVMEIPEVILQFGEKKYSQQFKNENSISWLVSGSTGGGKILTETGLQDADVMTLADSEIVLTYELYAKLFQVSPKWSYVSTDLMQVVNIPQHIGQSFDLKFIDFDSGETLTYIGTVKIAGISFSFETSNTNDMLKFSTDKNTSRKIDFALDKNNAILVQIASITNLKKFLVNFREKHEGYILNVAEDESMDYSSAIYGFEQELFIFKILFAAIAAILTIILILFVINLISFSITNRKKEIGILSALGATNKDIIRIFIIETIIISVITFVVNLLFIIIATLVFNQLFCSDFLLTVPLFRIDAITIITLAIAAFGLLLVAALIPLRKIIKLKPINAIKNL